VLVSAGNRAETETYIEVRLEERIVLAAHAQGVGSGFGWLGVPAREGAKGLLGIPQHKVVRTVISLGYADEPRRSRSGRGPARKPLGEIVYEGRYA